VSLEESYTYTRDHPGKVSRKAEAGGYATWGKPLSWLPDNVVQELRVKCRRPAGSEVVLGCTGLSDADEIESAKPVRKKARP